MKFRLTFEPAMKRIVEAILKNEEAMFVKKFNKSRTMRVRGWLARRRHGIEMNPYFLYEVFDRHADITIDTGLDWLADKKRIFAAFQKYEEASDGKISVEMLKDE
jgi:hypothetical protein